jgi:hypothetical protein
MIHSSRANVVEIPWQQYGGAHGTRQGGSVGGVHACNTTRTRRVSGQRGKMDDTTSESLDVTAVDVQHEHHIHAQSCKDVFPFLRLPRELRDTVRPRPDYYQFPGTNLI